MTTVSMPRGTMSQGSPPGYKYDYLNLVLWAVAIVLIIAFVFTWRWDFLGVGLGLIFLTQLLKWVRIFLALSDLFRGDISRHREKLTVPTVVGWVVVVAIVLIGPAYIALVFYLATLMGK